jgi:RNA-directed DNA polymerase
MYKPVVKSSGAKRESDGVVVLPIAGMNPTGGKGPDFGHVGDEGKHQGMAGTARPNFPDGHLPSAGVRKLQNRLWAAAKQSEERRFHALYDRIYRPDVLWEAWEAVRVNRGSAGVDAMTIADVEAYGVHQMLGELQERLRAGSYHPAPLRRVEIPKPDGQTRPLGIPTVKDRVAQQAAKLVLEPIFEADFLPCSFGFRPKRSALDAMEQLSGRFHQRQRLCF